MSENRNDDAQQTGGRIGTLPASDQEMGNSERGGGGGGSRSGQPSPEATQPSPEATQPSPEATQPSPDGDAQRSPSAPPPQDPES
jgi:hypothetical protein